MTRALSVAISWAGQMWRGVRVPIRVRVRASASVFLSFPQISNCFRDSRILPRISPETNCKFYKFLRTPTLVGRVERCSVGIANGWCGGAPGRAAVLVFPRGPASASSRASCSSSLVVVPVRNESAPAGKRRWDEGLSGAVLGDGHRRDRPCSCALAGVYQVTPCTTDSYFTPMRSALASRRFFLSSHPQSTVRNRPAQSFARPATLVARSMSTQQFTQVRFGAAMAAVSAESCSPRHVLP